MNSITKYQVEQSNVGKILNIYSSDLNILEAKLVLAFKFFLAPLSTLYVGVILWIRFNGPIGLLCMAIITGTYPLIAYLQKLGIFYGRLTKRRGDNRVLQQDQLISDIRQIKMSAFEKTFFSIVSKARDEELDAYKKLQFIQSCDKAILMTSAIWITFSFFLITHYIMGYPLKIREMIVTIQLMSFFQGNCLVPFTSSFMALIAIKNSFNRVSDILSV